MNKHVVLHVFVFSCKNVVLQNISNFVNYSILIAKKQFSVHFCGWCCIIRSDMDFRSQFCAILVLENFVILGISVLVFIFLNIGLWKLLNYTCQENKYNLAFQEHVIKDYKKGVKQKEIATKYPINKSIVEVFLKRNIRAEDHAKHVDPLREHLFVMSKRILLIVLMIPFKN